MTIQGSRLRPYVRILRPKFKTVRLNHTFSYMYATSEFAGVLFVFFNTGKWKGQFKESGIWNYRWLCGGGRILKLFRAWKEMVSICQFFFSKISPVVTISRVFYYYYYF